MRRKLLSVLFIGVLLLICSPRGYCDSYTRGKSDHPLRYVAYAVHPFGIAVEYWVLRPIHKFVSGKNTHIIFGHEPTPNDVYCEWR